MLQHGYVVIDAESEGGDGFSYEPDFVSKLNRAAFSYEDVYVLNTTPELQKYLRAG
jgi:hypothetical protein